jgi:hypothetical protein
MSYVIAAPEMMTSAAADLATVGSDLSAAHLAAAAPTVGLIPAAADEVSAAVTKVFSAHAAAFQGLAGKAAAFRDQFVSTLKAAEHAYSATEAAAAGSLISYNLDPCQREIATLMGRLPIKIQGEIASLLHNSPPWLISRLPLGIQYWLLGFGRPIVISGSAASLFPPLSLTQIEQALAAFLANPLGPQSINTTEVLAAIEVAILAVTSPLWLPVLVLFSPVILLFILFAGVLAAA